MNKKIKILFHNFGRLEKILFYNLFLDDNFEILGIISTSDSEQLTYFLKQDSIHGKFLPNDISFQNSKKSHKILFNKAKQSVVDVFDAKKIDKKTIAKMSPDIIIDLSNEIKFNELNNLSKIANWVVAKYQLSFQKKKNFQLAAYYLNHNQISVEKADNIILVPEVKTTIIASLTKLLKNELGIDSLTFENISGANDHSYLLDTLMVKNRKSLPLSRSIMNNIIPVKDDTTQEQLKIIFEQEKIDVLTFGLQTFVPVQTGAFLSLTYNINKVTKEAEINEILNRELGNEIAISTDSLVSQDIISNTYYGIISKDLTQTLNTKKNQIIRLGVWYDSETSEAMSFFKTIQYLSGLKQK